MIVGHEALSPRRRRGTDEHHQGASAAYGISEPARVTLPPQCAGWEELYPPHILFADDRRAFEESRFWFQDAVHYAEPYYPFDVVCLDSTTAGFSQASARLFVIPTSLGLEYRILGGYVYLSPNSITDEATIAQRAELFTRARRHYYGHWNELDARGARRSRRRSETSRRSQSLTCLTSKTSAGDRGPWRRLGPRTLLAYDRLLEGFDRVGHYHFELVNLGYGAYLGLYELCRQEFPDISDQAIAMMVSGIDVVALRPDDELRRLA